VASKYSYRLVLSYYYKTCITTDVIIIVMNSLISDLDKIPQIEAYIKSAKSMAEYYQRAVDGLFLDRVLATSIDLGIIVYLQVDPVLETINRVALSDTDHAKSATKISAVPFHDIKIPLSSPDNSIAKCIRSNQYQLIDDWCYLFTPSLTAEQARLNQKAASIESSLVLPLKATKGALIFSFYQPVKKVTKLHISVAKQYAELIDKSFNKFKTPLS
jgi:hypothetical protein